MVLFNCDSENEKNIKVLFKSLSKIKDEIAELKKKTSEIEEYKSYAERMSKENEALMQKNVELMQNNDKKTQTKWPLYLSIGVGLLFLIFSAVCVGYLFFSTTCVRTKASIPMLIAGVIVYFFMAVILVCFAYQSRHIFSYEGKNKK